MGLFFFWKNAISLFGQMSSVFQLMAKSQCSLVQSTKCSGHNDELRLLRPVLPVMHLFTAWSLGSLHDCTSPRYSPQITLLW
jgi:hypothetical protein